MTPRCCPYCQQAFQPSKRRPDQVVCSQSQCQNRRRSEYRRKKRQTDPEYAQGVRDSRCKWREAHPDYQKQYRQTHPEAVTRNRQQQRQRDQKRRVGQLLRNTAASAVCAEGLVFTLLLARRNIRVPELALAGELPPDDGTALPFAPECPRYRPHA